jgi:hypothetical protein
MYLSATAQGQVEYDAERLDEAKLISTITDILYALKKD